MIRGDLVQVPSNHMARSLYSPPPFWRGLHLCQLVASGADTTTVRIEWMKRLSGGCRSASMADPIQHPYCRRFFRPVLFDENRSQRGGSHKNEVVVSKRTVSGHDWRAEKAFLMFLSQDSTFVEGIYVHMIAVLSSTLYDSPVCTDSKCSIRPFPACM